MRLRSPCFLLNLQGTRFQGTSGATFQAEPGVGITAPFRVPANNIFGMPINVQLLSTLGNQVPSSNAMGLGAMIGLLALAGGLSLVRRKP